MTIASTEATYNTYNITFHFYIVKIECKLKKTEEPKENINRYDPRQDRNSIDFMTYTKRNASINTKMKNCQISISSTPEVCLQDLLDNLKDELDTIVEAQKFIDNIFEPESKKLLQEVAKE